MQEGFGNTNFENATGTVGAIAVLGPIYESAAFEEEIAVDIDEQNNGRPMQWSPYTLVYPGKQRLVAQMAPLHGFKDPRESGKMTFTIQIRPMNPSEEAHAAGNVLTQRLYKYIYEIALEHGDIVRNVKCKWNTLYKL